LHLTDRSLAALREPQVESVPDFEGGVIGWGLGWMLYQDGVVGHTGVSKGQKAFLRVAPSAGVAVAVPTNSTGGEPLAYEVFGAVLRDLADVETSPLPVPPLNPTGIDADRMCGTYRSALYDFTLTSEHCVTTNPTGPAQSCTARATWRPTSRGTGCGSCARRPGAARWRARGTPSTRSCWPAGTGP